MGSNGNSPSGATSGQTLGRAELHSDAVRAIKAIGDQTRLQILSVLLQGERCVTDIAQQLGLAQPRISHHLTILRNSGLVVDRRNGKRIYYSVNPEVRAAQDGGAPAIRVHCLRIDFVSG